MIFVALLAIPVAELWVIVSVAGTIGIPETIGLLILISIAGAWLLKQQGMATWRRVRIALERGEVPTSEATDGGLILFGGALLMTPGFLTDIVGLFLLLPPTRALVKGAFRRQFAMMAARRMGGAVRVYETSAEWRSRRGPSSSSEIPPEVASGSEVDSPDKG